MSELSAIKKILLGEKTDRMRKLDLLVRQGMMPSAQLPMLHRGLDKLQAGKTLSPQERDAVAKVMDSLLFIVTGDDTVFQKAKMHTQKTKYQTEEVEELDEEEYEYTAVHAKHGKTVVKGTSSYHAAKNAAAKWKTKKGTSGINVYRNDIKHVAEKMDLAKADMGDVIKDFRKSDAPQFKGKSDKKKQQMAIAAKLDAERNEETEIEEGAFSRMDYKQKSGEKGTGLKTYKPAAKQNPLQKRAAANKKALDTGFMKMPDYVKKKFGEETEMEEGATTYTSKNLRDIAKGKTELITNPKTKKVSRVTPSRAKMAVKKGFSYAEEWTDEELDSLFEMEYKDKFQAMLKKTGKSLDKMSDEEKKKFFNTVDAAHKAKNEEVETFEEGARADAMRAMKYDKKGMATVKKSGGTKSYKGPEAGDEKHGGHIVMQLRKAVSVGKPVKFKDGESKVISKAHAHKFLSKYNAAKPAEKEDMHKAHDSHDTFMKHINN